MNSVASTALCWGRSTPRPSHSTPTTRPRFPPPTTFSSSSSYSCCRSSSLRVRCATNGSDAPVAQEIEEDTSLDGGNGPSASFDKNINRVVQKTAATFAPRASTASKNPAVPGTILYSLFELQGYASMVMGGALAFNLIFPSDEPDIWRLMGMWSVWMFTIPSLRARDCSKNEKEALNYLFLAIPLINVAIPFFWKSFAVVWSADVVAFFIMYAWKLGWLQKSEG